MALAYDEYSGIDTDERYQVVRKGVKSLGFVHATGEELGHSVDPCDCCGDWHHGDRYRATKLERVKRAKA